MLQKILLFYRYLYYRIRDFWIRTDKTKDVNPFYNFEHSFDDGSALSISVLIQVSNILTLLILPMRCANCGLSEGWLFVIILVICLCNVVFINTDRQYQLSIERWHDEPPKRKKRRGVLLVVYMIISFVMMFVSLFLIN